MAQDQFSYDAVPYPSYTFPQTHPDRLSTIGSLYGIETAHPEQCRVLELGCGDGTNILSFAYALPDSKFVGIDLSKIHIERAQKGAADLELKNASFLQADISTLSKSDLGQFDFVIAHGLYSWVPDTVRGHLHRIFRECLAPNGVGYISYNAYPGCHIREISSEIMKFGSKAYAGTADQVSSAKRFLTDIAAAAESDSLYQTMLKIELSHIVDRSEQNVFHDDLSELNRPFYFSEFVQNIARAGLKFISEADPVASHPGKLSAEGQSMLRSAGGDNLLREQLIDLITCRRFRCSLVCRAETQTSASPDPNGIRRFFISGRIDHDAADDDIRSDGAVTFRGHDGTTVQIDHPLTKAALACLRKIYARRATFDGLIEQAAALLGSQPPNEIDIARTANILDQFYSAGLLSFHRYQPKFTTDISDRPQASHFARWQIRNGSESVTSLAGINLVPGNTITKIFLSMLDGTRTRPEILEALEQTVDIPPAELDDFRRTLPSMVEMELSKFAEAGLLIG